MEDTMIFGYAILALISVIIGAVAGYFDLWFVLFVLTAALAALVRRVAFKGRENTGIYVLVIGAGVYVITIAWIAYALSAYHTPMANFLIGLLQ